MAVRTPFRKIVVAGQNFVWKLRNNSLYGRGDRHIVVSAPSRTSHLLIDPYAWDLEVTPALSRPSQGSVAAAAPGAANATSARRARQRRREPLTRRFTFYTKRAHHDDAGCSRFPRPARRDPELRAALPSAGERIVLSANQLAELGAQRGCVFRPGSREAQGLSAEAAPCSRLDQESRVKYVLSTMPNRCFAKVVLIGAAMLASGCGFQQGQTGASACRRAQLRALALGHGTFTGGAADHRAI